MKEPSCRWYGSINFLYVCPVTAWYDQSGTWHFEPAAASLVRGTGAGANVVNGYRFVVGSHIVVPPAPNEASLAGDPYLFPVRGPPIKLPSATRTYRLYQHRAEGFYVDATVDHRAVHFGARGRPVLADGSASAVVGGYYITELRLPGLASVDLCSPLCLKRRDLPWVGRGIAQGRSRGIICGTYRSRTMWLGRHALLEIRVYHNAQIRSALSLRLPRRVPDEIDGLLYRNYVPKAYAIRGKHRDFWPRERCTRRCTKGLVAQREVADSVLYPEIFGLMMFGSGQTP